MALPGVYSDFEAQPTDALRLGRLMLYIAELQAAMIPNVEQGTTRVDLSTIQAELVRLDGRRRELEAKVGVSASGRRLGSRFVLRGRI